MATALVVGIGVAAAAFFVCKFGRGKDFSLTQSGSGRPGRAATISRRHKCHRKSVLQGRL